MRTLRTFRTPLRLAGLALAGLVLAAGCGGEPADGPEAAAMAPESAAGAASQKTASGMTAEAPEADTGEGGAPSGRILPDTDTVEIELLDSRAFKVSIESDGSIRMNDQPVSKGELPYRFASLKRKFEEPEMLLRHPKGLPYEQIRAIIDMAQEAGITDINVMTHAQLAP